MFHRYLATNEIGSTRRRCETSDLCGLRGQRPADSHRLFHTACERRAVGDHVRFATYEYRITSLILARSLPSLLAVPACPFDAA